MSTLTPKKSFYFRGRRTKTLKSDEKQKNKNKNKTQEKKKKKSQKKSQKEIKKDNLDSKKRVVFPKGAHEDLAILGTFSFLISNKYSMSYFEQFLITQFSQENLEFWKQVNLYQNTFDLSERIICAKSIIEKFVIENSESQVNIDSMTRTDILSKYGKQNYPLTLFNKAEDEILKLMETDSFSRFKRSPLFKKLQQEWEGVLQGEKFQGPENERTKIFFELYNLEEAQIKTLDSFSENYIKIFTNWQQTQKKQSQENRTGEGLDTEKIFGNFIRLEKAHKNFYLDLQKRKTEWTWESLIGDCFLKFFPELRLAYLAFSSSLYECLLRLEKIISNNKDIQSEIQQGEWSELGSIKQTFESFVKLLTDWKQIFSKLIQITPQNHPDFRNIETFNESINKLILEVEQRNFIKSFFPNRTDFELLNREEILYIADGQIFTYNSDKSVIGETIKLLLFKKYLIFCFRIKQTSNPQFFMKKKTNITGVWCRKLQNMKKEDGGENVNVENKGKEKEKEKEKEIEKEKEKEKGKEIDQEKEKEKEIDKDKEIEIEIEKENEKENENKKETQNDENKVKLKENIEQDENLDNIPYEFFSPEFSIVLKIKKFKQFYSKLTECFKILTGQAVETFQNESRNVKFKFSNKMIYNGNLKNGKFIGKGKLKYPNNAVFEGMFKDNKRNGFGTLRYPSGALLYGNWLGQARPGQARPGQAGQAGQARPGQARQARPGQARPGQARPGQARPGQARPGQAGQAGRPGQARPGQARPQARPGQARPGQARLGQARPGQAGQARPGQARPGQARPGRPGQARPGQARPGQARPGQARPGQARPGQARLGQARPGQARPGQARPGQARPGQARPGQARPGQARPGQAGQARPGQARPGQARPGQAGQARPGQARPGQARPGQARPGQARPGQARPGQARARPGQARPGQARPGPGQARPGQARPGQARPGQARPGQARPGQARPGQARPGQARPGQASQARPGQAGQARPGQARPGQAGQARPGQARPGQARPGQARPGQARPGQAGQARPGQARPGQARPGQARPGQARPGQARLGQARPGQARPGQARPG
ncbi:hypothetical protein M0813_14894 [Anaeramoeba flamelloides]|uniref:RGS domain-containing protein n=1 Tax=Anaeramoeba flamelloides TaxID=1746091 RepID=A0ABQ8Z3R0_9EUKA|nr:hypothetical protein M0813_14894 [Anaeramoeba flamelloides]